MGRTAESIFISMILKGKKSWLKGCFRFTSSDTPSAARARDSQQEPACTAMSVHAANGKSKPNFYKKTYFL
jgi:hypothetical protein